VGFDGIRLDLNLWEFVRLIAMRFGSDAQGREDSRSGDPMLM
jgi:hypothetical protein